MRAMSLILARMRGLGSGGRRERGRLEAPPKRVLVDSREGRGEVVWARWDYVRDRFVSGSLVAVFP